jgi:hypothetical protein
MAIDKVTSASITTDAVGPTQLNEASNYAFTGTVTGAGESNAPSFSANNTSTTVTASLNTAVKATFDNELYDTASAYDTSNSRFTVPSGQAGKYYFETSFNSFESTANNTSTGWSVYLYKNGSNLIFLSQGGGSHTGNARMNMLSNGKEFSVPLDEANTDYKKIQQWISEGNTVIDNGE